jgi:hypothetical protein
MHQGKSNKEFSYEGYSVPENYFNIHKLNLMSKIENLETHNIKLAHSNILKKSLLVAASLLLLLMFFPDKEQVIGTEDIISYVESTGIDTWEEDIIIDAISLENINNKSSEELINYLEDTDLDIILETI